MVSDLLGHSTVGFTLQTYTHPNEQEAAAAVAAAAVAEAEDGSEERSDTDP